MAAHVGRVSAPAVTYVSGMDLPELVGRAGVEPAVNGLNAVDSGDPAAPSVDESDS